MRQRLSAHTASPFLMAAALVMFIAGMPADIPAQPSPTQPGTGQAITAAAAGQGARLLTDIHDIKALVPLDSPIDLLYVGLIGAAVLALAAGLAYVFKRRRRTAPGLSALPRTPPETAALQQLAALRDVQRMDGRVFYFQLSAILRVYIEARYGFNAAEMTTEELLPKIEHLALEQELAAPLRQLLTSADPIKFAGMPAVKSKMESDLGFAHRFVEDTTAAARASIAEATDGTVKV